MAELVSHAPDNPDFARVIQIRELRGLAEFEFEIAPTEGEAVALARLLGATSVRRMRFRGRLTPIGSGGWRLEGTLGATVVQPCVVTLEPVTTRIDQPVRRTWASVNPARGAEVVLAPGEDDEPDPLSERIDLGMVATEALALAVPDYPRKPGASLAGPADPTDGTQARPFAALSALRGKPDEGS